MSSGMWHRTLVYLGLREEAEEGYDDVPERFDPVDDPHATHAEARPRTPVRASVAFDDEPGRNDAEPDPEPAVRPLHPREAHVRAVPQVPVARAAVIEVGAFDEVEAVGARYRTGQAVLFDLSEAPRHEARRVVDFVSGLTYALRGELTKVGSAAFLVVPAGVELPADERRRLSELGYRVSGSRT